MPDSDNNGADNAPTPDVKAPEVYHSPDNYNYTVSVTHLRNTLPRLPYPANANGNPYITRRWEAQARKAGYPPCKGCGRPLVISSWGGAWLCNPCDDADREIETIWDDEDEPEDRYRYPHSERSTHRRLTYHNTRDGWPYPDD
jgi:hypothetical protein